MFFRKCPSLGVYFLGEICHNYVPNRTPRVRSAAVQSSEQSEFSAFLQEMTASHPSTAYKQKQSSPPNKQTAPPNKQTAPPNEKPSPPNKPTREPDKNDKRSPRKKSDLDFSAAVDALAKLDISSMIDGKRQEIKNGHRVTEKQDKPVSSKKVGSPKVEKLSGDKIPKEGLADKKLEESVSAKKSIKAKKLEEDLKAKKLGEGSRTKESSKPKKLEEGGKKLEDVSRLDEPTGGEGKKRELSPSVAAMFEAVSKKSSESLMETTPNPSSSDPRTVSETTSTALKNLLHIGSPPSAPFSGSFGPPGLPNRHSGPPETGVPRPHVSDAVLKLMRPPMSITPGGRRGPRPGFQPMPPRPGLLPNPYTSPPQFPIRGGERVEDIPLMTHFVPVLIIVENNLFHSL